MRASEIRTVDLEATEDGILEVLELSDWTDFGEDNMRVYRLWIDEKFYRDVNVTVGEVA